jgi:SPP1 gp7 family putative phage head morphogenesis protein
MTRDEEELLLYDEATRTEVYSDGVKVSLALLWLSFSAELRAEIRRELLSLDVDNLGELTKGQLNTLIYRLRATQNRIHGVYSEKILKELERFAGVTQDLTKEVYGVDKSLELTKLWAKIKNTPMPANGVYLDAFIKQFENSSIVEVENALRKAWVNGDDVKEILSTIAGKSGVQGVSSVIQTIERRASAVAMTTGHHVFSKTTELVLASAFGQYRWVSVMDSRTSEICRDLNNKVFTFGLGPVPPAHIRCRSHIAPTLGGTVKPENLGQWLKRQPEVIRAELQVYANGRALTISEFAKKGPKIKI